MPNARVRTIHRAVQTLGGAKALADAFGVKPALVESWPAGTASPDSATYLAALDIVARGSLGAAKGSEKSKSTPRTLECAARAIRDTPMAPQGKPDGRHRVATVVLTYPDEVPWGIGW